jgi:fatty-acyl-CoA synthase
MAQIRQAVVVGVPDRRLGEVGCAFVQLQEGETLTRDELMRHCKAAMADYKVPRHVHFVDDFPRTTTGKIQRFVLQKQACDQLAA